MFEHDECSIINIVNTKERSGVLLEDKTCQILIYGQLISLLTVSIISDDDADVKYYHTMQNASYSCLIKALVCAHV